MPAWDYLVFVEATAIFPVADNVLGPDDYPTIEEAEAALLAATGATGDDTIIAVLCPHNAMAGAGIFRGGPVFERWIEGEPPPQNVLDLVIARAQAAADLPGGGVVTSPAGTPDIPLITQLDTWLWIDNATWQPITATPPPIFGITATLTATPYRVTFETSEDGQVTDCGNNTGTVWTAQADGTTCSLTWQHTSAGGEQTLTTTVHWQATYTCTAFCGTGDLPDYVTQTTQTVTVAELQAIGTQ